ISEPGLLAAVELPRATYGPEALEGEAIDESRLSRLQLEGVIYIYMCRGLGLGR
ncbi:unnamed protein product, partial [Discosporangium mesarthrocarpum]